MSMNQVIDFGTLSWIKNELDEVLREARQALQAHAELPDPEGQAEVLVTRLHQVCATLRMVELGGASMLAEEMECVARAIRGSSAKAHDEACEVLMRAILQLPDYLDRLIAGHGDMPLALLPVLNGLRAVRGEEPLSEIALFSPDLSAELPEAVFEERAAGDIKIEAKALRHRFQRALLGWFRGQDLEGSLNTLADVLRSLQALSRTAEGRRLWWVAGGVVAAMQAEALESSVAINRVIGQLDRHIKGVIDVGEATLVESPPDELTRNLLFYIGRSRRVEGCIAQIQSFYRLDDLVPGEERLAAARESLSGQNSDLFATVGAATKEELGRLKDSLDIILRGGSGQAEKLQPLIDSLRALGDTLGMLGMDALREPVMAKAEDIAACLNEGNRPSEPLLMDIASNLLSVEVSVDRTGRRFAQCNTGDQPDKIAAEAESGRVTHVVLHEAIADLVRAKEAIVAYMDAGNDRSMLNDVPRLFNQVKGGLSLVGEERAAALTASAARYVENQLIHAQRQLSQQELESFADCICGIEYYLETRRERRVHDGAAMVLAEQSMEKLGHSASEDKVESTAACGVPADEHKQASRDEIDSTAGSDGVDADAARGEEGGLAEGHALMHDIEQSTRRQAGTADEGIDPDREQRPLNPGKHSVDDRAAQCDATEPNRVGVASTGESAELVTSDPAGKEDGNQGVASRDDSLLETDAESPAPIRASECQIPLPVLREGVDEEILDIFLEEAEEEIACIDERLTTWLEQPQDVEALSGLRRSFHTLKGSGRLAGAVRIGEFAWANENMLNRVIDGSIGVSPALIEVLQRANSVLPDLVREVREGTPGEQPFPHLMKCAEALSSGQPLPADAGLVSKIYEDEKQAPLQRVASSDLEESAAEEGPPEVAQVQAPAGTYQRGEVDEASGVNEPRLDEERPAADEIPGPEAEDVAAVEQGPGAEAVHSGAGFYSGCDPELIEIFLRESEETLETGEAALDRWRQCFSDAEALAELQRTLHTLKGAARMAGFNAVGDLAHAVESHVIAMVEGQSDTGPEAFAAVHKAHDRLVFMLEHVRERKPVPEPNGLIGQLDALRRQAQSDVQSGDDGGSGEPAADDASVHDVPLRAGNEPYGEADPEILGVFLEEAGDILDHIDETLQAWRKAPDQHHLMSELQRELHTLKGGARMADITVIGDLAHAVESLMTKLTEGEVTPEGPVFAILEESHDRLAGMVDQVRRRQPIAGATELLDRLELLRDGGAARDDKRDVEDLHVHPTGALAAPERTAIEQYPTERRARPRGSQELVRIKANLLDNMVNFAGEVSIYRSRLEQQIGAYRFNLIEMEQTVARLRDQLRKLEIETEAQILFRYEREGLNENADFDPLEMDRYSKMQHLSRSLIESVGDLASIQHLLENITRESETLLLQQSRVNTELQEGLMRTRMVPFLGLAARMRRIVRQTSHELGKQAELELSGAEGEMDRTVVDRIIAPIEHMLRNAISHGIEYPEQRREAGKPETGMIRITLERESSDILLKIADDGAGMNFEAIRRKAIERGVMQADADLSDKEILQFVLETGFSTAERVTQVAGRGVGMDVVNSEVKQLGGSLAINSESGRGTTFTMRLPFTLALNQALLVEVGEDVYAIPLSSIEGVARLSEEELDNYYADADARFSYGGMMYEVCHLGSMLGTGTPRLDRGASRMPVLLARTGDRCVGFQVESLLGSREIVVKSVGPQVSTVRGITGATILGDGRVVMILDVSALLRGGAPAALTQQKKEGPRQSGGSDARTVMVVDDSITVRKVATRLLERNDMKVIAAKDGVDAVARLQEHTPDIILLDIEMPRMDGFELATHIRNEARLHHTPIIMITSRSGDKHRQRAMQIGVNRYLGKPFQEKDLLDNIRALLDDSGFQVPDIDG
jgi:chemosensory pili system protein ChpA (sensor histidine kinase/response regulator)